MQLCDCEWCSLYKSSDGWLMSAKCPTPKMQSLDGFLGACPKFGCTSPEKDYTSTNKASNQPKRDNPLEVLHLAHLKSIAMYHSRLSGGSHGSHGSQGDSRGRLG